MKNELTPSREIKFRVWDVQRKQTIHFDDYEMFGFINHKKSDVTLAQGARELSLTTDPTHYIWRQFTGLKDKNGTEIYEGDIVELDVTFEAYPIISNENDADEHHHEGTFKVVWDNEHSGFDLVPLETNESGWFLAESENELTVIGNIYQNPELLK